jgi:hypothetical protein
MNTLIRLRPNSIVLGLMGRVNYAWAQLDLISTAAAFPINWLKSGLLSLNFRLSRAKFDNFIEKSSRRAYAPIFSIG